MDPTTDPFPFSGEWPNLQWSQELCRATLSLMACKVLPYNASVQPDQAYKAFLEGSCLKCLRTRGTIAANSRGLPEEPVFLKHASWRRVGGRWGVQMRMPPAEEHSARVDSVVARFSSCQDDQEQRSIKQAEMRALLSRGVSTQTPPLHRLDRLLCWVAKGAPPHTEGMSRLLQGSEGHNLVCQICTCKALCLFTKHLRWGSAADRARVPKTEQASQGSKAG